MRIALGVVCSAVMLAGCGGAVAGEAAPTERAAGDPVFSPCDDIPDEAIRAIGMDPATEARDIMDVHQPGWNICGWNNSTHFLSVFATTYTLDDIRGNDRYTDFSDLEIDHREMIKYRDRTDTEGGICDVATRSGSGAVMISISEAVLARVPDDPCTLVVEMAGLLVPHIPE
ncbi:DUF3558 domain-containing protein [Prescottella defluvii]|uniref:DUF3558 domain-containing protein n=1 Tax=Prescottella defluvii TaxID=1323361 RepID=UPI000A8C65F8|nr:DUF3558 domain-containing protein [Prescottella defluvii]